MIWRKLREEERGLADSGLIRVTFELLIDERFDLARKLLDFSTETIKKHSDEVSRRIFIINRAQAYKWLGNEKRCADILDAEDWSATEDSFKLCVAVLRDDFDAAAAKMIAIGPNGSVKEQDYQHWPVFRKFREQELFRSSFEKTFGHPPTNVEEIAKKPEIKNPGEPQ